MSSDYLQAKLAEANALKDRLLSADSDALFKNSLLDTDSPIDSLHFIPASQLEERSEEYERLKDKMDQERAQRGTFNLSEMIFSDIDSCANE